MLRNGLPYHTFRFQVRRLGHRALDLVYPESRPACLLCHRPLLNSGEVSKEVYALPENVCMFCRQDAQATATTPIIRRVPLQFSGGQAVLAVLAGADYQGFLRNAIRQWKYDGALELTPWLVGLMVAAYRARVQPNWRFDLLVPVPPSAQRLHVRGYHHVGILATELQSSLHIPVGEVLLRPSATMDSSKVGAETQTTRNAAQRRQALQGAFVLRSGGVGAVTGARILLVDDVLTTGSTLSACATVLYDAGAAKVVGLTIANVR